MIKNTGAAIEYVLLMLMLLVVLSLGVILLLVGKTTRDQIEVSAIGNAQSYVETLKQVRSTYTTEIVSKARNNGMSISHFHKGLDSTIPLPATLTILLGEEIGKNTGIGVRLYSPFPFPWREVSGGLRNDFSKRAWDALLENPEEPYFEIESVGNVDNRKRLRYAVADVMQQACVDCHNSHPQTPKADWEAGNVRGILEVNTFLESGEAQTAIISDFRNLQIMSLAVMFIGLSSVGALFRLVRKTRRLQREKEEMAQKAKDMINPDDIFSN